MKHPSETPTESKRIGAFSERLESILDWFSGRRYLVALGVVLLVLAFIGSLYSFENWRGKRAWHAYEKELKAIGVVFDWGALAPPPVPDDQNFAMTPLLAPLFDFLPEPDAGGQRRRDPAGLERAKSIQVDQRIRGLKTPILGGWLEGRAIDLPAWQHFFQQSTNFPTPPRPRSPAEDVLFALSRFEDELDELRSSSQRPYARFNIDYDAENTAAVLLPHFTVIKNINEVLVLRAVANLSLGRTDQALDDLRLVHKLADSIQREPILISFLVRTAVSIAATQVVWEGLVRHQWTDVQLIEIQKRFTKLNFVSELEHALKGERAAWNRLFPLVRKDLSLIDRIGSGGEESADSSSWLFGVFPKGWFYFEQVTYHRYFDQFLLHGFDSKATRVYPGILEEKEREIAKFLRVSGPFDAITKVVLEHRLMLGMFVPAGPKACQKAARAQAVADQAEIACALERFRLSRGAFPENLSALVPMFLDQVPHDVLTGDSFIYRRAGGDRFILYSVGWDLKDDGGTAVADKERPDWVWFRFAAE